MDKKILSAILINILVISLVLLLIIIPNIQTNDNSDSQIIHQSDNSSVKTPKWDYENRTLTTHEFNYSNIVSFNISDELTDNTHVDDILLGQGISYKYDCGLVNSMGGLTTEGSTNTIENMDNTAYYEKLPSNETQQGYKTYIYKDEGNKYDIYQVYIDINDLKVISSDGYESNYAYFHGYFPSLKEANVFIDTFKVQFNNSDAMANNLISKLSPNRTDIENTSNNDLPESITLELPEFDKNYTKNVGEYTVEAKKWRGGTLGELDVFLYKNGEPVYKDSYLSRAYFYKDGEWKWSEWGNGQGATYHKYPLDNDIEIKEIEVKF